ncbi:GNAT family N-acetyltransferase [Pelagibius sp. 7325]|uniref:GNAT family N-acetyltransferase n=1 Tax=Pelagibius sp. 7325 TaxID=3131994 RepID=UPI0030ED7D29
MTRTICHLFEVPGHRPVVANWIYEAFWFGQDGYDPDLFECRLGEACDADRIPLSLLALDGGTPAGTANLIVDDYPERPQLTPWLAALYVDPPFRRRGHATALGRRLLQEAARLDCPTVYLTTHIPDFYRRFGAEVHEQIGEDFWILRIDSKAAA